VGRTYEISEKLPDTSPVGRGCVSGRENAIRKCQELATITSNKLRMMPATTKTVMPR
jgi:hypothetical protein